MGSLVWGQGAGRAGSAAQQKCLIGSHDSGSRFFWGRDPSGRDSQAGGGGLTRRLWWPHWHGLLSLQSGRSRVLVGVLRLGEVLWEGHLRWGGSLLSLGWGRGRDSEGCMRKRIRVCQ